MEGRTLLGFSDFPRCILNVARSAPILGRSGVPVTDDLIHPNTAWTNIVAAAEDGRAPITRVFPLTLLEVNFKMHTISPVFPLKN